MTFTVQRVRPGFDGYASAIWTAPTDGMEPARQLTLHDPQQLVFGNGRNYIFGPLEGLTTSHVS